MEKFEVPISWHKSYKGNLVEFAGFVITKSRKTWIAFRPYKGTNGFSSVLNVVHALGEPVTKWGTYWARARKLYLETLGLRDLDLSPLLHEEKDNTPKSSLPGSKYFGSLFNRVLFTGTDLPQPDSWLEERHALLKEEWSILETRSSFDSRSTFNPEDYKVSDRMSRYTWWDTFHRDPLVRAKLLSQEAFM